MSNPGLARGRRRRATAGVLTLGVCSALLAACGGSGSGKTTLVWYINPDTGGQAAVAAACSTDQYTITTQTLPTDANQQRVQLARRLEAGDTGIDLMSIDPPYTAEFSNAGLLAPISDQEQQKLTQQSFKGATAAATWNGRLVVYPFWSNTQVLWYRKSFVAKAGINMQQPVSWDQIIKAASANGGQIGVQANKYEGYVVWINALDAGAGGTLVSNADKGVNATINVGDQASQQAAKVIEELARSSAAPPDLSVSNEGTAAATFGSDAGSFMVNWTFIYHNYDASEPNVSMDIGYTQYPQTVSGQSSRPPYGGIGIGVSSHSNYVQQANEAADCIVSPDNQALNAALTGNMPASQAGYDSEKLKLQTVDGNGKKVQDGCDWRPPYDPDPAKYQTALDAALKKLPAGSTCIGYPPDLLKLFQDSVDQAAPRSVTPYWSDISGSLQSTWHPPSSVTTNTPKSSAQYMSDVLHGRSLL
jgi:multiple sugar transport system substrate-binding protein